MAGFVKRFLKGFTRWVSIKATNVINANVPTNTDGSYKHLDMTDVAFLDANCRKIGHVGTDIVMRQRDGEGEYKRCVLTYLQALGHETDLSKQTSFAIVCSLDGTIKQIETDATLSTKLNWCTTNITPYADDHIASKKYVDDKASSIPTNLPNYSNAVSLNVSTYTATANGFVVLAAYGKTTVNGVTISDTKEIHMYSIPVSIGDTVSANKIHAFIPFK